MFAKESVKKGAKSGENQKNDKFYDHFDTIGGSLHYCACKIASHSNLDRMRVTISEVFALAFSFNRLRVETRYVLPS